MTRGDSCIFFCFNVKILFRSGDSYGDSLVTRLLINWTSLLLTKLVVKDSFSNQYFVLCPWHLITLSIRLGIDSMVLSITLVGKVKTVWIILFENCLKVSFVRFLLTASSLSLLPIRWKTFSIGLRSGERAGILNNDTQLFPLLPLISCSFVKDHHLGETTYLFYCFLSKTYQETVLQ